MSYADMSLDLKSVSVACLSGSNGSGKSALLDAITWAIWERARAASDDLVRIGESEMWVDLIFEYENRTYRVRRSRQRRASRKGGKATTKGGLEFQVLTEVVASARPARHVRAGVAVADEPGLDAPDVSDAALGHWRSLTAATMRETQQVISSLLRMDYDTFINSAYLKQGKADEFTMRPPGERKQVLSEILGLAYFDQIQESCKLRARESKMRMELLAEGLKSIPEVESLRDETLASLSVERQELVRVEGERSDRERELSALREKVAELSAGADLKERIETQVRDLRMDVTGLGDQSADLDARIAKLKALIESSEEIESQASRFTFLKDEIEELDKKAREEGELDERRRAFRSELANMRSRLEVELEHAERKLAEQEKKKDALLIDTAGGEKLEAAFREYKELIETESALSNRQDNFVRLSNRAKDLESAIIEARIKLEAQQAQLESSLAELDEILGGEESLAEHQSALKEAAEEMDRLESEFELVEQKGMLASSEIKVVEQKVLEQERRIDENREKVKELREHDHTSICPLCSAPIVDRAAVIARYESEETSIRAEILRLNQERAEIEKEREELRRRYRFLKGRLAERKELDKRIGQFNERFEAIERAATSRRALALELEALRSRLAAEAYAQVERESLINIKAEIFKLDFDPAVVASIQSQLRMKRHLEGKYQQYQRDRKELEQIDASLPELRQAVEKMRDQLASELYGADLRSRLLACQKELDALGYDRQAHLALKEELSALLPFAEKLRELNLAMAEKPELERAREQCLQTLADKKERIVELEAELIRLEEASRELPYLKESLTGLEQECRRLSADRDELSRSVAVLENNHQKLHWELEDLREKEKTMEEVTESRDDYLLLAEAFGKKGIQAAIIENAVPEIESEANRILARLSDNKMHVALVTQHKTKAGTISETLDILIGDEVGTRAYDLYSGGEAFKVNFAIRIALSRLLARRAGARLETLIIDEGFGSQDAASRDRLVRAIKSIQSDFAKIIVITHIADVREMFPTQIQVTKEFGVSSLRVVG